MRANKAKRIAYKNLVKRNKKYITQINSDIKQAIRTGKSSITVFKHLNHFDEDMMSYYSWLGYDVKLEANNTYKLLW